MLPSGEVCPSGEAARASPCDSGVAAPRRAAPRRASEARPAQPSPAQARRRGGRGEGASARCVPRVARHGGQRGPGGESRPLPALGGEAVRRRCLREGRPGTVPPPRTRGREGASVWGKGAWKGRRPGRRGAGGQSRPLERARRREPGGDGGGGGGGAGGKPAGPCRASQTGRDWVRAPCSGWNRSPPSLLLAADGAGSAALYLRGRSVLQGA